MGALSRVGSHLQDYSNFIFFFPTSPKDHSVDLALWGHEHSYQRMCHVYKEKCDNVSTVHAIVGMGGQTLGSPIDHKWVQSSFWLLFTYELVSHILIWEG